VEVQSVGLLAVDFAEVDTADVRTGWGDTLDWKVREPDGHARTLVVAPNLEAVDEAMAFHLVEGEQDHVDLGQRKAGEDLVEAYHLVENKVYCFAS
jgi:hypothetical protein